MHIRVGDLIVARRGGGATKTRVVTCVTARFIVYNQILTSGVLCTNRVFTEDIPERLRYLDAIIKRPYPPALMLPDGL